MESIMNFNPEFPDWIRDETRNIITENRLRLYTPQIYKGKVLKEHRDRYIKVWEVENRLFTDRRLKPLWEKFYALPNDEGIKVSENFLSLAGAVKLDAQEMALSEQEKNKIKSLKARLERQAKNLIQSVNDVDLLCSGPETKKLVLRSVLDGDNSYKNQIIKIKEDLLNQLDFYNRQTLPRIHMFVRDKKALGELLSIKKRAKSNFMNIFIGEAISILFSQWFGQSFAALAQEVAMVITNTPAEKNITRRQLADRTKKRRQIMNSRAQKK